MRRTRKKREPVAAQRGLNFKRTIAFVTQKGGSGKSTLAACLAVAAHEKGERVFLIDTDPLMSLSKWAKARKSKDILVEWVRAGKLQTALAMLEKKGITLAIIDTGAGEPAAAAAAIKAARSLHHPGTAECVRSLGERAHAKSLQRGAQGIRLPAQPMPAGATERAHRRRRQGARSNGRIVDAARLDPGRLPGSRASWDGHDRAQSARRRGGRDARPLGVGEAPHGAGEERRGEEGGLSVHIPGAGKRHPGPRANASALGPGSPPASGEVYPAGYPPNTDVIT